MSPCPGGGALLMDGRRLGDEIVAGLRATIDAAGPAHVGFATVLVGGDGHDRWAARAKHRQAEAAGIVPLDVELPATASAAEVRDALGALGADAAAHGIFVHLPLPGHLDPASVLDALAPDKDVDGLTTTNVNRLANGEPGHVPCTPLAVLRLLDRYGVGTAGRRAVVVGRSPRVAMPAASLLARAGATVTVADADAPDLNAVCRRADIVVAAADVPGVITADHVRPGAAVVDAGVTRAAAGVVGDVDEAVCAVAGALAPMPGGVGPVTIACLLAQTLAAARRLGAVPHDAQIARGR